MAGTIDLYKVLNKIPEVTEAEAREVADSIAHVNDIATKADLAELKTDLIKWMVIVAGIIIAAMGLMFKL